MNKETFSRIRDWVEPAHPAILEHYEDLLAIYTYLRGQLQQAIDRAFDHASRRIGFVVATTMPAVFEIGQLGRPQSFKLVGEHLKGTLFEEYFTKALTIEQPILGPDKKPVRAGTYNLYLIWFDALKLRLRRDWIEPAHFRLGGLQEQLAQTRLERAQLADRPRVDPGIPEPAHWFDPGTMLDVQDVMIVSVLDEVYPELRLADRIAFFRQDFARAVRPEVMEPAHFHRVATLGDSTIGKPTRTSE